MMPGSTNSRKTEHIRIINEDPGCDLQEHHFDSIRLTHRALPEIDLADVDTTTVFLGKKLSFPLIISSMTGGADNLPTVINRNLATAAEACGVAMGVGSQRVMFEEPRAQESFAVRQYAPTALLCANLGAVQLNNGFGLEHCKGAVECLDADALYFHLNPLQEAIQPGGDCNFGNLADRIGDVVKGLDCPVIVKEVGCGISAADARLLVTRGVRIIDVAGRGGTSWSHIEQKRKDSSDALGLGYLYRNWGIPTPACLQSLRPMRGELDVIASGGVRNGLDMAKGVILGARLCGLAKPFLAAAQESPEAVITVINRLKNEFRTAMFLTGCSSVDELRFNDSLIVG